MSVKIQRGYKTELRLNNKQKTACLKHAGAARFAYNWGMNQKKMAMEVKDKIPNAIELHRRLNALKKDTFPCPTSSCCRCLSCRPRVRFAAWSACRETRR